MDFSLCRLILYVQNVSLLSDFYRQHFGLTCVESIPGEWAVLQSGSFELTLHLAGAAYRGARSGSNVKLVFETQEELTRLRERFLAAGVMMREIKAYEGFDYHLLDGTDPEGNVFQIMQKIK